MSIMFNEAELIARREKLVNYFKVNRNRIVNGPIISKELGYKASNVYTDLGYLKRTYPDKFFKVEKGYMWKEDDAQEVKTPVIIDNAIDVEKNASGIKDPVASEAISSFESSVCPGRIYACKNGKGIELLYLTVRGPFESYDGVQKITVVPVFRESNKPDGVKETLVKIYSGRSGKSYYIYPYEISSKPVKYLYMLVDKVLDCDLGLVKEMMGKFIDIPERVVYKTITKEVEKEAKVETPEPKEGKAKEELKEHLVRVPDPLLTEIKLLLKEQEAAIYKDLIERLYPKEGDAK